MKLLALLLFLNCTLFADEYLLTEMIALKDSIDKSAPEYPELTRRLADVYFDLSIQEGGSVDYRKNALKYYNLHINGSEFVPKTQGETRINILFQTARLNEKIGQRIRAAKLYHEVFDGSDFDLNLKRQTALHLAEYYEEEAIYSKASKFYDQGIELCQSVSVCNYAHYRKAWLLYKDVKLDEAIAQLKLSLWHQDGTIREKVLNDYFLFSSQRVTDGNDEITFVKELTQKTKNQKLIRTLVESFYSAGNRIAGSNVLEYMNSLKPELYYELRLLEEYYGFRNWEKVKKYLHDISLRSTADIPSDQEEAKIAQTTIRRFIVQIDAESERDESLNPTLLKSIDAYLSLYPNDELREKMQQGWLKAQSDKDLKLSRLALWITQDIKLNKKSEWIHKMRTTRLSMAQDLKKTQTKKSTKEETKTFNNKYSDIILAESKALSMIAINESEKRKFEYIHARELYANKSYALALPIFEKLASLNTVENKNDSMTVNADEWGVLSQNLALDIFNKNKEYSKIMSATKLWIGALSSTTDKRIKSELSSFDKIEKQARFEYAISLGDTKEALDIFYEFCFKGIFEKKACSNSLVISRKLDDQARYVSLLEKDNKTDALIVEYELMGEYSKTAELLEKRLNRKSTFQDYFRVSLLYELDMDLQRRDQVLNKLISSIKRQKKIDAKFEPLLYTTLSEASMLNHKSLSLPWSLATKLRLVKRLELEKPSLKTQKFIISQKESVGPLWSKMVLQKITKLDKLQAKVKFYGQHSKWLFKKRTRALEKLNAEANNYLQGSDIETRSYILDILISAYGKIKNDILNTPLPEGLSPEILEQVNAKLAQMAAPFIKVKDDYQRLLDSELAQMTDLELKQLISQNISKLDKDYVSFIQLPSAKTYPITANLDDSKISELKSYLKTDPTNIATLNSLKTYYSENESERLASYYSGRLNNLKDLKKDIK